MIKENKTLYPEIEVSRDGESKRYRLIYGPPDSQEGYFYFWPESQSGHELKLADWLEAYTTDNLSIKLYLIGSIFRHRGEEDLIGSEMQLIVNKNEDLFLRILNKYFDDYDDGLLIKQDSVFIDLLYGPYSRDEYIKKVKIPSSSDKEEEYNDNFLRLFEDDTLMRILDEKHTWDFLEHDTFIASESFDELVQDLLIFEQLLR